MNCTVDVERVTGFNAVEDNRTAAVNSECQFVVAEGVFGKGAARRTVGFENLEHIARIVIHNLIGAFVGFVNEDIIAVAAVKRIISGSAPKGVLTCPAIEFAFT